MKARILIGGLAIVLVIGAAMVIAAWSTTPKLLEQYPTANANDVPATTAIRLTFSRPMAPESVINRLKITPSIPGRFAWNNNELTFTPSQAWPAGSQVELTLDAGARAASWLSFSMSGLSWSFKTSDAMLAYLWPSQGAADIYALTPTTGTIVRMTKGMSVLDFSVNSSGIKIYFSGANSQGGANLYMIDLSEVLASVDQSYQVQEVLECKEAQCRNPVVSADGQYLAYEYILPNPGGASGPAQVWVMDLSTQQASPVGLSSHETLQPAWSSNGNLVYYDRTSSGYEVTKLSTEDRLVLPNQTGQPGDWSPDGQFYLAPEIYYYQAPDNSERGTSHLIRYRIPDSTSTDMSGSIDVEDAEAVYAPDGSKIAFARKFLDAAHWTLGRQLWIMNADGNNAHPITDEADFNHYDLAWSRDGKKLAYVRFDETRVYDPPELWMVNADGSDPIQLVIGGFAPLWIP